MNQNTFDLMISKIESFTKEIFSPNSEEKFQIKLMETLEQAMEMGKSLKMSPKVSRPGKKPKLDQSLRKLELPNELWTKIIKYLPGKVVYGQLAFVNKRFQSLALKSEVLRTINASYMSKNSFKSLKQLTMPIQILCQFSLHQDVVKAIKVTKNLKSLVFKNDWFDTYDDGIAEVQRGQTIYDMGIIQALKKSKSKLEHLSLTGYYVEPVLMIELAKVKTLKIFQISDARRVVITPEVVNTFAKSENQLESIEFDDTNGEYYDPDFSFDDGNDTDELNEALNNLLEKKSKTLKSLKYITWD